MRSESLDVQIRSSIASLAAAFLVIIRGSGTAAELPATKAPASTPIPLPALQKKVDFQADVLPILKRNCLACHNATDAEGDLVLETPATISKGGESGPAVVPKKGLESYLIKTT